MRDQGGESSGDLDLQLLSAVVSQGSFELGPLDHHFRWGEPVWLSGRNGCGKSTLLLALAGLLPRRKGVIQLGGECLSSATRTVDPKLRHCAILLQDLGLWPHMSISAQCRLMSPTANDTIDRWSEKLGLNHYLDRLPADLSGGQAQRAALMRTLCTDAQWYLLDEPYSAQHQEGEALINSVLCELAESRGLIVAGHRPLPDARSIELTDPE